MDILIIAVLFNFLGSFVSLLGGIFLLWRKNWTKKITPLLIAFAAGTMLAVSFFDLLPEAFETIDELEISPSNIFNAVLFGLVVFFVIERFILWSHHHHSDNNKEAHPTIPLLIIGDTIHNFLDGVTIAATFLVSLPLGIVTSLAVGAHEIPQEIGDFGTMLHLGIGRKKVIIINIISALVSFIGVIIGFYVLSAGSYIIPILLGFAAGNFIYIAASDLIPEIHSSYKKEKAVSQTSFFLVGIILVYFAIYLLEGSR
ncbi:ZIP family metal transporter [Candidatus Gottesmanbacteria bacterium]|nr:ZIP family metal transporter [Candidatus Gottesmanbacteria bacterium]